MRQHIKKLLGAAVVSVIVSVGVAHAVPTVPVELLPNGDFATGALSPGWTIGAFGIPEVYLINTTDTAPDSIVNKNGVDASGPVNARPGSSDNFFIRGGIPGNELGTQAIGYRTIYSDPFIIPLDATSTDVSLWWRFMTWDKFFNDQTWAVVRKSPTDVVIDRPCGVIGGTQRGGTDLQDTGWQDCNKSYDTLTLVPGEKYYLRLTLLTVNDNKYPSWSYADDLSVKSYVPVPEPSTLILLGGGLVSMYLIIRIKERRSSL
ncbi:MAG: PEP-CTERM sorting domain-containing protein [Nitrospira sp.]|nr:PEP-CTERM sorting domain-containing protein [Nitrospira sp.]